MKTGKSSKIDRITHILEGRKDSKFEHNGHAGGLTNKEKLRKKNFVMVRKGKKSVNNKTRKAAGLDRHEKNSAVSQYVCVSVCLSSILTAPPLATPFYPSRIKSLTDPRHLHLTTSHRKHVLYIILYCTVLQCTSIFCHLSCSARAALYLAIKEQ